MKDREKFTNRVKIVEFLCCQTSKSGIECISFKEYINHMKSAKTTATPSLATRGGPFPLCEGE